ncbi:efflux RND transporter periplasmic adaptor subunit [Promicromonospora vindobonensis]|uniref:Efflux RND transporter periplasmic adaptor subunit n=1 Tax=Promicromonospora vindobonensis TaxID=195748 RepID=A0ABW5W0R8_9MICO
MAGTDETGAAHARPRRQRRRLVISLTAVAVVAGGAGFGIHAVANQSDEQGQTAQAFRGATDKVVRSDLEGSTTAQGTLRFADPRPIQSARPGVVTGLPKAGSVVSPGERLYAVDNVPVFLLRGALPAWRDLAVGMSDGPDVRQLEQNLRDLGHLDVEPDETFTWTTVEAIMDWQEAEGQKRSGTLPLGSVLFADGDLRIGPLTASVGSQTGSGSELFEVSDTSQVVNVDLRLGDQRLAVVGNPVIVHLPGGSETTGKITSVGSPTEAEDSSTVIPVVISLDAPKEAAAFQEATVNVDIPSERRKDVLSVPVGALIAITPEQFGVEVVAADGSTRQIPVTTGLFAGGRVEISGDDVRAGQRVVVPRR